MTPKYNKYIPYVSKQNLKKSLKIHRPTPIFPPLTAQKTKLTNYFKKKNFILFFNFRSFNMEIKGTL